MIYWNNKKAIKSGKMPYIDDEDIDKFEKRLNEGKEVKMKGWTFRKDDTGRISVVDPDGNLLDKDFKSVASFIDWFRYWKKDSLKSSRKITSSNKFSEFPSSENMKKTTKLHKYILHWRFGDEEIIEGTDIVDAMNKAGIGIGALGALDYYEEKIESSLKSSKRPLLNNVNFYKELVRNILSNRVSTEDALDKVCVRENCNKHYATTILQNWMDKYQDELIKSDAEIMDIQKEFDVDGDLNSWAEDYMPGSGTANTKGGELVRAAQRILAEYYNNGNMIGRGYGNEVVNPAARYIVEKTNYDGNGEIEDMLNHIVYMTDEEYNSWCKRFENDFADYLREKPELFSEPNEDDIADYKDENDKEFFLNQFYIEDESGNQYSFIEKDDEYVCDDIMFANEQLYYEDDIINDGDELSSEIDKFEDYGTIEKDGFTYDWEAYGDTEEDGSYKKWKVVRVTISDQLFEVDDVVDMNELENYKIYDVNGNEIKEEDFMKL